MRLLMSVVFVLLAAVIPDVSAEENKDFRLSETVLTIPQVDYEGAIYYTEGDPYPHLDFKKVRRDVVVDKEHRAIIMENAYIKLTLLPQMGRVYSLVYKPTGHEELWRNDIVNVCGQPTNDLGWWMYIGGVEYTLPGYEHGTTWAEVWKYRLLEDSEIRKAVRMTVVEKGTKLQEDIDIVLYPDRSYYEAHIRITNPTQEVVEYSHWINPQWTPGGHNELTDNTEFILPTERILIYHPMPSVRERFREHLGPSPQQWAISEARFIKGWKGYGDLMADGLKEGFYSAYSHDEEEGMVRVFDKDATPGVNIWTFGYHPSGIPMGSGAENKGYVEIWGGTPNYYYPTELHPIGPGEAVQWTEWMYPYQGTGGLTYANRDVALNFFKDLENRRATLGLCASKRFDGVRCTVTSGDVVLFEGTLDLAPDRPFRRTLVDLTQDKGAKVTLTYRGEMLAEYVVEGP